MKIDLSGQVILVTGAAGGIGEAIVNCLADAGATVAMHYLSKKEKAEQLALGLGHRSKAFYADLNDHASTIAMFREVLHTYSRIDCLVNNAGVFMHSPVTAENEEWMERWQKTMNINLNSAGLLCKLSIQHFLERQGGRIITISSRAAFRGDTEDYLAYAASKAGLVALSRSIARAYGKNNIKSFIIAPGFVRTAMADAFISQVGEDRVLNEIALPKLTLPEDVAPTVLFMASGLMDHATGCSIDINAASYVH